MTALVYGRGAFWASWSAIYLFPGAHARSPLDLVFTSRYLMSKDLRMRDPECYSLLPDNWTGKKGEAPPPDFYEKIVRLVLRMVEKVEL